MLFPVVGIFVCLSSITKAQYILGLAEGEICNDKQEGQWICTAHKQCAHVDLKVTRPPICSFRGRDPIICCPPKKKLSKAEMNCQRLLKKNCIFNSDPAVWEMKPPLVNHVIGGKPSKGRSRQFAEYTKLCDQFNTFRNVLADSLSKRISGWIENDDNEAAVLEISSNVLAESQTPVVTENVATSTQSSVVMESNTTREFANNSLNADVSSTPASPNGTSGDVPQPKHFYVMGGHYSLPRTHRHMALIGYGPKNDIDWRCGGSLISDQWVLSAAHCTTTTDLGAAKWARLGELDHASTTDDAKPQDRRIIQRINHPQYRANLKYNDIALYKLESRVLFDQYVAPICLHTTFDIDQPKATVIGWGRTDFADDLSSKLMEVDISLINNADCRRMYGNGDASTPRGIDGSTQLCAGEREGGKDACTGDSGGPLVINQAGSCLKKQVGITSFGRDCGLPNSPGIYTRVSTYVPWIESIVWP